MRRVMLLVSVLFIAVMVPGAWAGPRVIKLRLQTFIQRGLPERDVLVERDGLSADQVNRVAPYEIKGAVMLSKMAFTTTKGHKIAPEFGRMVGPFPKGQALGFTFGQWLAARGAGGLAVDGDAVELKLSFQRLIPNGLYTLWCVPVGSPDTPCGAADGTQNVIRPDANGNATFEVKMTPMPAHMKKTGTIIALAYHSNGKTYGGEPGEFGVATHVSLVVIAPPLEP